MFHIGFGVYELLATVCNRGASPAALERGRILVHLPIDADGNVERLRNATALGSISDPYVEVYLAAGSRLRIKRMDTPTDYKDFESQLSQVVAQKKNAVEQQDFEEAGRLRDKEKELLAGKEQMEEEIRAKGVDLFDEVDEEAVAEVLSIWTGIPVYKLTEEETAKLLRMEDELSKSVVGQGEAVQAVSKAVRRASPLAIAATNASISSRASARPSRFLRMVSCSRLMRTVRAKRLA